MNAHRQLGKSAPRTQGAGSSFPASLPPCIPASPSPCVPASMPAWAGSSRITSHQSRITAFKASLLTNHHSRITRFLIDTPAIRIRPIFFAFNTNTTSNRHSKGPFPFCTIATKLAKVLYLPRDFLCYSHRRTRVPPLGLRALAPARPTWCESFPLPGHRELSVSGDSQYRLEASKLNGDFRARSYAN